MSFLRRSRPDTSPAIRGRCACLEHIEDLDHEVVHPAPVQNLPEAQFTVGELVRGRALGVHPPEMTWRHDWESGTDVGPFHFSLWLGDETRCGYDDAAEIGIDDAIRAQPGVEIVDWEDREVFHVSAPRMCADGVLAAAARALMDPRVKT